jgi:hypothetical protein
VVLTQERLVIPGIVQRHTVRVHGALATITLAERA